MREEYLCLYKQLCELHWARYSGAAIVEQPGIGKSYFIIYALLWRTGRQVLFSTSDGDTYRFDEEGVRWMRKDDLTLRELPGLDSEEQMVWSLIDADDKPVQHQQRWLEKEVGLTKCLVAEVWTDEEVHKCLILVRRNGDSMAVSIKTVKIAAMLLKRLAQLRHESAHGLFLAAVADAETKVMAGRIFEVLAIQHTRGERPALQSLGFYAMESLTGTKTYPHRFQHTLTTPKRVIDIEQDKLTLGVPEPHESCIPVNSTRRLIEYAKLAECALDPEEYYRPRNPNNPLFDSFFSHEGQDNVVVWVFQMTIAKDDDDKTGGFVILAELVARVQEKFPQKAGLKYVLVVPYQPDVAVRCRLSPGWDEVRGEAVS
ncbi:hypothetical protein C8Q80DRAFT_1274577 [Daedaleopsis nitida]|nr:hypothetical protein C8Q80DRAFT_1274577 [Daedaleopsis nitida]